MAWPKTITTLVAEDICKGTWRRGDKCCLQQWVSNVIPFCKERKKFEDALMDNLERLSPIAHRLDSVIEYNDRGKMNLSILAEAWNETLRDLGYDA